MPLNIFKIFLLAKMSFFVAVVGEFCLQFKK